MKVCEVGFRVYDKEAKEYNRDKEVLLSSDNKIYRIHTITGELQQLKPELLEDDYRDWQLEVIGNIHENRELIDFIERQDNEWKLFYKRKDTVIEDIVHCVTESKFFQEILESIKNNHQAEMR